MKFEELKFRQIILVTILIGLFIFSISLVFFQQNEKLFSIVNMIAVVAVVAVPVFFRYEEHNKIKKIEATFPKFLRDITENLNTGMTLPQAFKAVSSNDYGALSPYVNDMTAKISFGITFENVLKNFSRQVSSVTLKRNVQMIIETHKSGGTVSTVLEAVANSLHELENIKKQRSSSIYAQMLNGYIIYIVFLIIMISLSSFLLPTFESGLVPNIRETFVELFLSLIVIQGFFSGIAIGKLSEGTFLAGVKHSLVLIIFGYSSFILFG
jgi:pilus assembly protein TadC